MDQPDKPARKPRKPKSEATPETEAAEPKKPRARKTSPAETPEAAPAKRPARARKEPAETPEAATPTPAAVERAVRAVPPAPTPPPVVAESPVVESAINTAPMPAPHPIPNALPVPPDDPDLFKPLPADSAPKPAPAKRATLTMPSAQQISAAASQGQKLARENRVHLMSDLRQALLRVIAAGRSAFSALDRGLIGLARPYGDIKKSMQESVQHWEESIQKSDSVVVISALVLAICVLAVIGLIVSAFQWW